MSGTNRLINSKNTERKGGKSALDSMLQNANQEVIKMDRAGKKKK